LRLRGEIELVRTGGCPYSQVEAMFLAAIDVAQRAGARVLALRASASLAKLWRRLDRINDAQRILASAQSEFSDGLSSEDRRLAEFLLRQTL
jgi:hypothetical protein